MLMLLTSSLALSVCVKLNLKTVEFGDLLDVYVFNMSVLEFLSKHLPHPELSSKVAWYPCLTHTLRDESVWRKEVSGQIAVFPEGLLSPGGQVQALYLRSPGHVSPSH